MCIISYNLYAIWYDIILTVLLNNKYNAFIVIHV